MKLYGLKELQELAAAEFQRLQVNVLYATSDGQFFLLKNRAQLHAGKGHVYTIEKEGAHRPAIDPRIEGAELVLKLLKTTDINEVNKMLLDEIAGANREDHVFTITHRMDELGGSDSLTALRGDQPAEGEKPKAEDEEPLEPAEPLEPKEPGQPLEPNGDEEPAAPTEPEVPTEPATPTAPKKTAPKKVVKK